MRIYVDTSVIGGCFDEEFSEWSNKLFDNFKNGKNTIVISDTTLEELQNAPLRVSEVLEKVPNEFKEFIILNEEALNLSEKYIAENIVSKIFLLDTRHIAPGNCLQS